MPLTSSSRIMRRAFGTTGDFMAMPWLDFGASGSQPLQTMVQPWRKKSALPASISVAGLFTALTACMGASMIQFIKNLRPRLVTSNSILWLPLDASAGRSMNQSTS